MSTSADISEIKLTPTGEGLGYFAEGIDLRQVPSRETVELLKQKLAEGGVLIFRDQEIGEDQQLAFTRAFGKTQGHPVPGVGGANPNPDASPEVFYLTNAVDGYEHEAAGEKEKARNAAKAKDPKAKGGIGEGELVWHTDLQYMPEPQVYSLLYGVETPAEGAETEWANMTAAYDAMSDELKEKLAGMKAIHWFTRRLPAVTHPAVRTHPITGLKALYVSPGLTHRIEGYEKEEGEAFIREVCEHATQRRFTYVHHWRPCDAIMWDNRCTMHRRHGFDTSQRRIVRRTQTVGEPVVA